MRELNAINTKENIFQAAIYLFGKDGFSSVTVEDITRFAKVSKGTFYTHFASKDNVLVEQFKLIDEQYEKAYEQLDKCSHAKDQIKVIVDTMCDYVQNVCGVSIIQVVYMNQISPAKKTIILDNQNRSIYRILNDIVDRGIKNGQIRGDIDRATLTKYIIREFRGMIYDWCMSNASFDLIEEGKKYAEYMCTRFAQPNQN